MEYNCCKFHLSNQNAEAGGNQTSSSCLKNKKFRKALPHIDLITCALILMGGIVFFLFVMDYSTEANSFFQEKMNITNVSSGVTEMSEPVVKSMSISSMYVVGLVLFALVSVIQFFNSVWAFFMLKACCCCSKSDTELGNAVKNDKNIHIYGIIAIALLIFCVVDIVILLVLQSDWILLTLVTVSGLFKTLNGLIWHNEVEKRASSPLPNGGEPQEDDKML